jgi:hypothetical protein
MWNKKHWPFLILCCGLCLRIIASMLHLDLIHPDEHFQILEPANSVINGVGWKSWEWHVGTRSWVIPGLYMPLLYILKIFNIVSGYWPIALSRALTALLAGLSLWRFKKLLDEEEFSFTAKIFSLMALGLSPAMIVWSGSTFSDTWAMIILWFTIPPAYKILIKQNDGKAWIFAGFLIGLTFLARVQMLIWPLGIFAAILFYGSSLQRKLLPYFALGYGSVILIQGFIDLLTWGTFLQSTVLNIKKNIFEGVADMNGISPWTYYFTEFQNNFGLLIVTVIIFLLVLTFLLKRPILSLRSKLILIPSFLFLAIHLSIGHKELRFLLPIFPAIFYLAALCLNSLVTEFKLKTHYFFILFIFCIGISFNHIYRLEYYSNADLSDLSIAIEKDTKLKAHPEQCLLIVDTYWIWTRGEMALGHKTNYIEVAYQNITQQLLDGCTSAIVSSWSAPSFAAKTENTWHVITTNTWGSVLFSKNDPNPTQK